MLTFKNLQDNVLTFLDQAGETGVGLDLVKYAIQQAHEKRTTAERWSFMLWSTPVTLTFVQGQRNYVLHPEALMLTDFWNTSTEEVMRETPTRARFKQGVQEDRLHFEFVQTSPVRIQPTTAGVGTVTGSLSIKYVDSAGDIVEETVTNAVTSASVAEVIEVTKQDAAVATLVVGGVTLLSLAAAEYGKTYPQIRLFDDGQNETGTYRFYRKPKLLTHNNDIPNIPYPFSRVLVYDALLELATYNDSTPPGFWVAQQSIWEQQLRQAYQEGEMEGSESRQVQEVDTYGG